MMHKLLNEWRIFLNETKNEIRRGVMCRKDGMDGMCDVEDRNGKWTVINFFPLTSSSQKKSTVIKKPIKGAKQTGNFCSDPDNEGLEVPELKGYKCLNLTAVSVDEIERKENVKRMCPKNIDFSTYKRFSPIMDSLMNIDKIQKRMKCKDLTQLQMVRAGYNKNIIDQCESLHNEQQALASKLQAMGDEETLKDLMSVYIWKPDCDEFVKDLK